MGSRRDFLGALAGLGIGAAMPASASAASASAATTAPVNRQPVLVGFDAAFRDRTNTADEAIRHGLELAIEEINGAGGVLGGRRFKLMELDNRSLPARGEDNVRTFIDMPELVAYVCGKFSPVVLEQVPLINQYGLPLLCPWAAADAITGNGARPNYAFRLGLMDSWALDVLMADAAARGLGRIGLMVPNNAWGRSCERAARIHAEGHAAVTLLPAEWHDRGGEVRWDAPYQRLLDQGAQAIVLVANESDGAALVNTIAARPAGQRRPVLSHWGISGGRFPELAGAALAQLDLKVVQTFSFEQPRNARARRLAMDASARYQGLAPTAIPSVVGLAHAYDLMHLLALAVAQAGSTDRPAVHAALEHLPAFDGVVRHYARPFTAERHMATAPADLFLSRYTADGRLLRVA